MRGNGKPGNFDWSCGPPERGDGRHRGLLGVVKSGVAARVSFGR